MISDSVFSRIPNLGHPLFQIEFEDCWLKKSDENICLRNVIHFSYCQISNNNKGLKLI